MLSEERIRKIIQEENEKHLEDIKKLLDSYGNQNAPKTVSVREAARILGFGVTKTYEKVRREELPYIKDGNKIRIPYQALINWMNQRATQSIS